MVDNIPLPKTWKDALGSRDNAGLGDTRHEGKAKGPVKNQLSFPKINCSMLMLIVYAGTNTEEKNSRDLKYTKMTDQYLNKNSALQ